MTNHSTGGAVAQEADIQRISPTGKGTGAAGVWLRIKDPAAVKQETNEAQERFPYSLVPIVDS
jgi:hypothetical protein